jgi:hypothetical protein
MQHAIFIGSAHFSVVPHNRSWQHAGMTLILSCSARQAPLACLLGLLLFAGQAVAANILFIGNSFTYAHGSPVRYYRPETVTDMNGNGQRVP